MDSDYIENIKRKSEEKIAKRKKRKEELLNANIEPEFCIVAWIDILGFSAEIQAAEREEDFKKVYLKVLKVQEAFDLDSASDEPEEVLEKNKSYGKTVLALSDGLVIAASRNCDADQVMTPYDFFMGFISDIIQGQAICAQKGIFLRGGISFGYFYYSNNVLLSPAMIKAYQMETKLAQYPIIIADKDEMDEICKAEGVKCYAPDAIPSNKYFLSFTPSRETEQKKYYHLDYIAYIASPANYDFYCDEDREKYYDRETYSPEKRDKIFNESNWKATLAGITHHKKMLTEAFNSSEEPKVKGKYRWMMDYHNRTMRDFDPFFGSGKFTEKELAGFDESMK